MPRPRLLLLRSPLFRRLFLAVALLALFPLLAAAAGAALLVRSETRAATEEMLRAEAALGREAARSALRAGDAAALDALAKRLGREARARFTFIAPDGRVLGDSDRDPAAMENHAARPEVREARERGAGTSLRRSDTLKRDMLYVALRADPEDPSSGTVRAALPADILARRIGGAYGRIAAIAATLGAAAVVSAALALGAFARAVHEVTAAAGAVASGAPMPRTDADDRDDELGRLARAVREMAATLEARLRTIADERDELRAVVSGLGEGLAAVDSGGRLLLFNEAAADLFGLSAPPPLGTRLVDAIRQGAELAELARGALAEGRPAEARLAIARGPGAERRICEARAAPFGADPRRPAGAVVLLRDVTEAERYERLRREFVANVSHELRTPVALVKGYLETLEDGAIRDPEAGPRFLEVLRRHVEGLERLVDDLLTLSALEAGAGRQPPADAVPVEEAVDAVLAPFEPVFAKKRLRLVRTIPAGLPRAAAPRERFERALRNLIDNAAKFTPEGGEVRIAARAAPSGGAVEISVSDTGPGIPLEEQARVFERFYRIDKSRSREAGGTGLGLAIVKHIVQQAGGTVSLQSEPGRGSTFTVTFPAR